MTLLTIIFTIFKTNLIKLQTMFLDKTYPSISQSWGIMGVTIVSMLIFVPLQLLLNNVIGKESSLLLYYILSMGSAFAFAHYIRTKETNTSNYDISPGLIFLNIMT